MKILVTGGTGFIGPRVVHALRAEGHDVRVLLRTAARARRVAGLGVDVTTGDVTDRESLDRALDGCTHVVHLVAIIQGRPQDFERVMTQGTENLVAAAVAAGVERFALMSALGTGKSGEATVPYFRAKLAMEQAVAGSGLEHVVFRPSFVFGAEGGALATFVRQVRYSPVVTIVGPGLQRSQPIWVDDVAAHVTAGVSSPEAANRTFELGGPDVVTWNELYARIARALGKRRRYVHVPFAVARAGARLTERLPGAPLSADQVAMLAGPDIVVTDGNAAGETFGLPLVPLDEQLRRTTA